jgi:tetratricopeptide (TPR) repeat protein
MKPRGLIVLLVLFAIAAAFLLVSTPNATQSASRHSVEPVDPELQQIRNLGKSFYENPGSANQAVEQLKKALGRNPKSAREHLNYGLSLLRAGQNEEGMAEIVKAREIDPTIPHTYFNLGIEYKKLGETEKAIAEFEQMRKLVPGEPKTHYNLGVLYKLQGDNEKAIASFEKAAELDPSLAGPQRSSNSSRRSRICRPMPRWAKTSTGASTPSYTIRSRPCLRRMSPRQSRSRAGRWRASSTAPARASRRWMPMLTAG